MGYFFAANKATQFFILSWSLQELSLQRLSSSSSSSSSLIQVHILFVFNDYNRIWDAELWYHRFGGLPGGLFVVGCPPLAIFGIHMLSILSTRSLHSLLLMRPHLTTSKMPHCVLISLLLIWSRRLQPVIPLKEVALLWSFQLWF